MPRTTPSVFRLAAAALAAVALTTIAVVRHRRANTLLNPVTGEPITTKTLNPGSDAATSPTPAGVRAADVTRCGHRTTSGAPCKRPTSTPPCATHRP